MSEQPKDVPVPLVAALAIGTVIALSVVSGSLQKPSEPTTTSTSPPATASAESTTSAPDSASVSEPAPASPPEPRRYVLDALESQVHAENAMRAVLKDPQSAEFSDVWLMKAEAQGKILFGFCGQVSARNSFGAFNGAERFVALPLGAALESSEGFSAPYQAFCVEGERVHQVEFGTR